MKRRKVKTSNIQTVKSEKFEKKFDESTEFILKTHVSQEIEEFFKKYDYITSDDRLSDGAVRLMLLIVLKLHYEVFTIEALQELKPDNENDIRNELEELINAGYVKSNISPFNQPAYVCNVD